MTERRFRHLWGSGEFRTSSVEELTEMVKYMEDDLPYQNGTGRLLLRNNIFKIRELIAKKKLDSEIHSGNISA